MQVNKTLEQNTQEMSSGIIQLPNKFDRSFTSLKELTIYPFNNFTAHSILVVAIMGIKEER